MQDHAQASLPTRHREPWNKGKLIGAKPPLRPSQVWAIKTRLMVEGRTRDLGRGLGDGHLNSTMPT